MNQPEDQHRRVEVVTWSGSGALECLATRIKVGLRRRSTVMVVPGTWPDSELDEVLEHVLVDANGDSEQLGSFEYAFAEAGLPVAAVAVGMDCSLDGVEFDGDERRGLVAVITINGRRQRLSLLDVVIADESHQAARLLAALRRWWVPPR